MLLLVPCSLDLTLEWRVIQGDVIRLSPDIAKNKDGRVIVLVGEIANIIARRRAERVESYPSVFHRNGAGASVPRRDFWTESGQSLRTETSHSISYGNFVWKRIGAGVPPGLQIQ